MGGRSLDPTESPVSRILTGGWCSQSRPRKHWLDLWTSSVCLRRRGSRGSTSWSAPAPHPRHRFSGFSGVMLSHPTYCFHPTSLKHPIFFRHYLWRVSNNVTVILWVWGKVFTSPNEKWGEKTYPVRFLSSLSYSEMFMTFLPFLSSFLFNIELSLLL